MEDIKKRAKNFSVGEIKLLFDLVKEKRNTLERRRAASTSFRDKNKVWQDIENSFNNLSGSFNEMRMNIKHDTLENEPPNTGTNYSSVLESGQCTQQTISAQKTGKLNIEQNMPSDKESEVYKQRTPASSVEIRNVLGVSYKEDTASGSLKQKNTSSSVQIRNISKTQKEDKHSNLIDLEKKWPTSNSNSATPNKKSLVKIVKEKHSRSTVSEKGPYKMIGISSSEEIRNVLCLMNKTEQSDAESDCTVPDDSDITGKFLKENEKEKTKLPCVSSSEEIRRVLCVPQKEEKLSDIDSDSTSPDADNSVGVTTRINHYQVIKKCGEPTPSIVQSLENKFKNLLSSPQLENKRYNLECSNVTDREVPKYGNSNVTVVLSEFSPFPGIKHDTTGLNNINRVLEPIYKMSVESKESQPKKTNRVNPCEENSLSSTYSISGFKKKPAEESKLGNNPSNLSDSSAFFLTHDLEKMSPRGSMNTLASAKTELVALQKQIHEQQLQFDREEQMLKVREHFLRLEILKLDIRLKQLDIKLKEKNFNTNL